MNTLRWRPRLSLAAVPSVVLAVMILTGASSCSSMGQKSSNSSATSVEFVVTGDAPNGVDITYGSDGSNYQGQLPLNTTMQIDTHAMYYTVTAQLQGGGDVTCSVTIGDQTRTGHAVGGYNICSAQLNGDFNGGWR